jgi:Fe-S cluster assembly iron-binding protein IscA
MERRINKKISEYVTEFKDDIKTKALQLGLANDSNMCQLVQYICDYERLVLSKDDFMKRKRVKNVVIAAAQKELIMNSALDAERMKPRYIAELI